ncbi:protein phosphatase 2C domain-containing protein [Planotetraspora phitsanulokensis]|uniref:Serine/threonine protein phosphatase PstP n=1 Tax=Planotetraspora phitsanulokensis TaxID=575192 RepID=A0A8J3UD45_9ACTN|nr:Stp1/IreP family PP2C-type Ser/Thr phosphatase [Planotetraspora phitsanulokensis]GII42632.1 serine/threonine protein phosphatase [Planotetraspora phitsanulokensis]
MTIALRYAARSDVGLLREGNEDSAYASGRLLAVADGMGGHAHGEVASSVAIAAMSSLDKDAFGGDLLAEIEAAVRDANHQLHAMVARDPSLKGMGTTLTAMLWNGPRFALIHVGDSRAYLLRNGELYQITHDHTLVQSLVDDGRITQEEAANHPQRSILLRALDGSGEVDPDLQDREALVGDRYLLCSDGLSTVVSAETLHHTLSTVDDPEEAVRQLIDLANRGGGPDNITCVLADVVEVDETQPPLTAAVVGAAGSGRVRGVPPDTPAGRATVVTAPQPVIVDDDLDGEPLAESRGAARRPKKRRSWPLVTAMVVVVAAVLGAGGYFGYKWTQDQFYVGASGGELVVFRGVDAQLGPLSLNKVAYTDHVKLSSLSAVQQDQIHSGIPVDTLQAGITTLKGFTSDAPDSGTPPQGGSSTPTPSRSAK